MGAGGTEHGDRVMEKLDALRVVRKIANFSRQAWPEDKIHDWVEVIEQWDRDLALRALEMHVLNKKLDSLSDLRDTYQGLVKRRQEETPAVERGRAGEDEVRRVKASIQAFLAAHPDLKRSYYRAREADASPQKPSSGIRRPAGPKNDAA